MKVLWVCNIVLPEIANEFGFRKQNYGGWLNGAWAQLKERKELELAICLPIKNPDNLKDGKYAGYRYYSFLAISNESKSNISYQIERFKTILRDFNPDVIHIWGTEFEHSYSMVKACEDLGIIKKVLVNVQGLLTYCERIYEYGIPEEIALKKTKGNSIRDEKLSFKSKSFLEQYIIKKVMYVSGRTDWDKASVEKINSDIIYKKCEEILRDAFYESKKWCEKKCDKHSIFISQAFYPIKGFHLILEELASLANKYPNLKIQVAGPDLSTKNTTYANYIMQKIDELGIKSRINFLGTINENQMIEEYLKANVFVSSSVIENSSNSVCEAMMLGLPVVASFVGGMPSIIEHGVSGYMYPLTEPQLMRYYVEKIFENGVLAENLSINEIKKSSILNDRKRIGTQLTKIYTEICK